MKKFLFTCTFLCMGTVAQAQVNSSTTSGAEQGQVQNSNSSVLVEGSVSSGVSTPSNNNTGPCTIGNSGGFSGPGFSIAMGRGTLDIECNTRAEAHMLANMVGVNAAVEHLCRHDETMRETLVARGVCKQRRPATPSTKGQVRAEPTVTRRGVAFTSCQRVNGQVRVGVPRGASEAVRKQAVRDCRASL